MLIVAGGLVLLISGFVSGAAHPAHKCSPAHFDTVPGGFRYGFPPDIEQKGLVFARKRIPINRRDVRERILKELNYWLLDRRSKVVQLLSTADHLTSVIPPILHKYQLPPEFLFLAAVESHFNNRASSPAGAFGCWQFMESTAKRGPVGSPHYDWKMEITQWKDERADLLCSTHSAARYLAWMNRVLKVRLDGGQEREGFRDWILTAAAYNAGAARVIQRMNMFGAQAYWDVSLPLETEKYVPRWIALTLISKYRQFYGVQVPKSTELVFDTVRDLRLTKDLTFAAMANLLKITPRAVWSLNSQIPSDKAVFPARYKGKVIPHTIKVPKGAKNKFLAQLKAQGYVKK